MQIWVSLAPYSFKSSEEHTGRHPGGWGGRVLCSIQGLSSLKGVTHNRGFTVPRKECWCPRAGQALSRARLLPRFRSGIDPGSESFLRLYIGSDFPKYTVGLDQPIKPLPPSLFPLHPPECRISPCCVCSSEISSHQTRRLGPGQAPGLCVAS